MARDDLNILVLGIGNLLWSDEGFGVRAVQALHSSWRFRPEVTLLDGGTQGFNLLSFVQAADRMIVFDALDFGLPPGTLKVVGGDRIPRFLCVRKLSLHQTGFQEVLGMAQLNGRLPEEWLVIGVQPESMEDYGGSLRPAVQAQILPAHRIALDLLKVWGCEPQPRDEALPCDDYLLPASLDRWAWQGSTVSGKP